MRGSAVSRRAAAGYLGAAAVMVGLGRADRAAAHGGTPVPGEAHAMAGTWVAMTAEGIMPMTFGADGSFIAVISAITIDPSRRVRVYGPALGHWEGIGEHGAHFTAVQVLTDVDGTYVGTWTFEGHPVLNDDHQIFVDEAPRRMTTRDAANTITDDQLAPPTSPIVGTRVGASPDSLVFPTEMSSATPTWWSP